MLAVPKGDDWVALTDEEIPVDRLRVWTALPASGAQVVFCGTVRDHAEGRDDVIALEYEAYAEHVEPRLRAIADDIRSRWPDTIRVALVHRVGRLELTEVSVVVAVSAPHRGECFAAAEHGIDTLKETVPIWKRELWAGGADWGTNAAPVREVGR